MRELSFYYIYTVTYAWRPTHGKCKNHYCVPRDNFCDIEDNCGDNSDEVNCGEFYIFLRNSVITC